MLAEVGPQVTGSYHIPVIISDMCYFLSCLQGLGHRLQAATTYLVLFQTSVIFCHACRGWATSYRRLPHTCHYFRHCHFLSCLQGLGGCATGMEKFDMNSWILFIYSTLSLHDYFPGQMCPRNQWNSVSLRVNIPTKQDSDNLNRNVLQTGWWCLSLAPINKPTINVTSQIWELGHGQWVPLGADERGLMRCVRAFRSLHIYPALCPICPLSICPLAWAHSVVMRVSRMKWSPSNRNAIC